MPYEQIFKILKSQSRSGPSSGEKNRPASVQKPTCEGVIDRWEKKWTEDTLCILWQGYSCRVHLVAGTYDARPDHESRPRSSGRVHWSCVR